MNKLDTIYLNMLLETNAEEVMIDRHKLASLLAERNDAVRFAKDLDANLSYLPMGVQVLLIEPLEEFFDRAQRHL